MTLEVLKIVSPAIFFFALLAAMTAAHFYYQRKAAYYADEILEYDIEEYNKQIRANAYGTLIRRSIWGLLVFVSSIWNYQVSFSNGFRWLIGSQTVLGICLIIWGLIGFRREMKRIREISQI